MLQGLNRSELLVFGYIAETQENENVRNSVPQDVVLMIFEYALLDECFAVEVSSK